MGSGLIIISDFALPGGMNGAQTAAVGAALGRQVPVVYLTGDIRSASLRDLDLTGSLRLTKPVRPRELSRAIQQLLAPTQAELPEAAARATIFVIDDDRAVREAMSELAVTAAPRPMPAPMRSSPNSVPTGRAALLPMYACLV